MIMLLNINWLEWWDGYGNFSIYYFEEYALYDWLYFIKYFIELENGCRLCNIKPWNMHEKDDYLLYTLVWESTPLRATEYLCK